MSEVLSPGVAYGCFELLDLIESTPMALDAARGLGKLGVVSARRVTDSTISLGWAEVNELGKLVPTTRGHVVRMLPLTESRLRRAILDVVETTDPPWVQNARFGRRRFLQYAPAEIAQLCSEAGLVSGSHPDVVAFWDTLAARARGLHDVQLNEIGREGERLTLEFEQARTGSTPRWIALDSNEDGYDVLSQMGADDARRLCIEVKTSSQGIRGAFYLTRNEWETAQSVMHYQMHLWDVSGHSPQLAIISLDVVSAHLPRDCGEGSWDIARVPFAAFKGEFSPPKH